MPLSLSVIALGHPSAITAVARIRFGARIEIVDQVQVIHERRTCGSVINSSVIVRRQRLRAKNDIRTYIGNVLSISKP